VIVPNLNKAFELRKFN